MAIFDEKQHPSHLEAVQDDSSSDSETFTVNQQAKIRHRIDRRLIPALGLMYGISLMDRKNVSNAAIAGMRVDLDLLTGYKYSLITLVFFLTYVLFQPPATVLCRKIGPRLFLPGICTLWGVLIIGFGFAQNWTTLVALRLILGILEAGYFPGCVYLLSTWYTRFQVAKRYSVFYLIGSLASALSGILAYALMQMDGVSGVAGWRWIFIIEVNTLLPRAHRELQGLIFSGCDYLRRCDVRIHLHRTLPRSRTGPTINVVPQACRNQTRGGRSRQGSWRCRS